MKKISAFAVIVLLVMASVAFAASVPSYGTDPSYSTKFNAFSTSTSTGNGPVINLGKPYPVVTCIITNPTGSTATSVNWTISGGIDSSNLVTLVTTTSTSFPALVTTKSATNPPISYMRGAIYSKATTTDDAAALRVDCMASH